MGLPSGVMWAPYNVDARQADGFAIDDLSYSSSFVSWGNTDTHSPTGNNTFAPWSWGDSVSTEPYASSPGAGLSAIDLQHDVARIVCGGQWRMPSDAEFDELLSNVDFVDTQGRVIEGTDKRVLVDGVRIVIMKSRITGATIKFPCCGSGNASSLDGQGLYGSYWATTKRTGQTSAYRLYMSFNDLRVNIGSQYLGMCVRPVMDSIV